MSQLRRHSAFEVILNTSSGFILALVVNQFLHWSMNIPMSGEQNLLISTAFTIVSLVRSYFWRRVFNWYQWRS